MLVYARAHCLWAYESALDPPPASRTYRRYQQAQPASLVCGFSVPSGATLTAGAVAETGSVHFHKALGIYRLMGTVLTMGPRCCTKAKGVMVAETEDTSRTAVGPWFPELTAWPLALWSALAPRHATTAFLQTGLQACVPHPVWLRVAHRALVSWRKLNPKREDQAKSLRKPERML